jgi:hypothetical protein
MPDVINIEQLETVYDKLIFADNDLVYGPSFNRALERFCLRCGGNLLADVSDTAADGFGGDWIARSIYHIELCMLNGNKIRFDLTNMANLQGVLNNTGEWSDTVTANELRYIRNNWEKLQGSIVFYMNDREVVAPWQN